MDWTPDEFEVLLNINGLSEAIIATVVHRGAGDTESIQLLIHAFHTGGDTTGLSRMMLERLKLGDWTCPVCKDYFPPTRRR